MDIGLAGGAGPTSFYFLKNQALSDTPDNRDNLSEVSFAFNGSLAGGLRWRLLPRGTRLRLDLRAMYKVDVIHAVVYREAATNGATQRTDFGSFDVFHGPSRALRGAF